MFDFFSPLRMARCGRSVAQAVDVTWVSWFALLFVSAIGTVVYAAYGRDVAAARTGALLGSRKILETRCGPIEYGPLGEGSRSSCFMEPAVAATRASSRRAGSRYLGERVFAVGVRHTSGRTNTLIAVDKVRGDRSSDVTEDRERIHREQ